MTDSNPHDDLDIHEASFILDPFPVYDTLRDQCPVMHSQHYGGFWLLTRYDDVRQATTDWRTYTSSVVGVTAIPVITPRTEPQLPIEIDPPLHSRYRALVNPVFSSARIEALRPRITAIVNELIDGLLANGGGDLVADYATPLSIRSLIEFTGLPGEDADQWYWWIRRMFNPHDPADVAAASAELGVYIDALIAERHRQPTDDFISLLIASEFDGHRLTDHELHAFMTLLIGAGFETTADSLSVTLHYLAEHSEERERLIAEPALIPTAVEEFFRYATPIQLLARNTTRDVELHGRVIPAGDVVGLGFMAANHDAHAFAEPERCILDRTPNRHLTFGAGPHLCIGAPVARLEMAVTLQEFLRRLPSYRLTPGQSIEWKTRGDRRGLATLPIVI